VGQLKSKKYRLGNHKNSKVEQLKRRMYNQRYHRTLKEGSRRKRTRGNSRIGKGGGYSNTRRDIQDTTSRNRTTN
jgi:hypothetical protein